MTQDEFFAYSQLYPKQVNIWYSEVGPPYQIKAVTIPALSQGIDQSGYLDQLKQVSIPLSTGTVIILDILTSVRVNAVDLSTGGLIPYYFFTTKILNIDNIGSSNIILDPLTFSPGIVGRDFTGSPYNTLVGSIEDLRQSSYIMQSDRYKVGTLANPTYTGPLNIEQLITSSATKANVQDSNYTITGWINSRYEGSKTNRFDYKTDSATAGRIFQASVFPSGSAVQQIRYLQSSSQVIYSDYFYSGIGDTPGFDKTKRTGYVVSGSVLNTARQIYITPYVYSNAVSPPPVQGNLITINNGSEIIKINQVSVNTTTPIKYLLNVTRGYENTATSSYADGNLISYITPVTVYEIKGNKLNGVPKGQVLVKETGALLTLDSLGVVVASN